jgi:putative lipoic acid-binding regulatory protein
MQPDDPVSAGATGAPAPDGQDSFSGAFDRIEQLLEFPVDFPIKVMGKRADGFAQAVAALVRQHVAGFDPATLELRSSSGGAYLSVTVNVKVCSRAQLEGLYRALAEHPMVRVVL